MDSQVITIGQRKLNVKHNKKQDRESYYHLILEKLDSNVKK